MEQKEEQRKRDERKARKEIRRPEKEEKKKRDELAALEEAAEEARMEEEEAEDQAREQAKFEAKQAKKARRMARAKKKAEEEGVHSMLGWEKPIMTDSGTFQSHVYGEIEMEPEVILNFQKKIGVDIGTVLDVFTCLLYTSPSPRDRSLSRMPSSA